jgi:hypothetical protein
MASWAIRIPDAELAQEELVIGILYEKKSAECRQPTPGKLILRQPAAWAVKPETEKNTFNQITKPVGFAMAGSLEVAFCGTGTPLDSEVTLRQRRSSRSGSQRIG